MEEINDTVENLEGLEAKAVTFLTEYLNFDNDALKKSEYAGLSSLKLAERKNFLVLKLIDETQYYLSRIEVELDKLQAEQTDAKGRYMKLKDTFRSYNTFLIRESKKTEKIYQDEFNKEFGKRLRKIRTTRKLSMDKLAKLVGLKPLSIQHYELGYRPPTSFTLYSMSKVLKVAPEFLLGIAQEDYANEKIR